MKEDLICFITVKGQIQIVAIIREIRLMEWSTHTSQTEKKITKYNNPWDKRLISLPRCAGILRFVEAVNSSILAQVIYWCKTCLVS